MENLIKKAVMVSFENYYCRIQNQLVVGTSSVNRAIKAVKEDQCSRKCDVKNCTVLKNANAADYDLDFAINL